MTKKFLIIVLVTIHFFVFSISAQTDEKAELVVQTGHTGTVLSVAFSPDNQLLASGSVDGTIKLWDAVSGKELKTLTGLMGEINSVAFSPDSKTLASGSWDKTIKLWDVVSGKEIKTLKGHTNRVFSVAFSPNGKMLASASSDKTIKLWDIVSGGELKTLSGHTDFVNSVAFSPDGKTLASGSSDKTIKLWDVVSGKEIKTLDGHTDQISAVVFSPNGKTLASASSDKTIKLWDVVSGKAIKTLTGHEEIIWSVAFSPDGKTLASGSWDKTVKLWDAASGSEIKSLGGAESSKFLPVAFSPDGKLIASGTLNNQVKAWNISDGGQKMKTLSGHTDKIWMVAFSPDGKMLAVANDDNRVRLWSLSTGQQLRTLTGHTERVYSVRFSPDSKTLASASSDNTIKLWDTDSGSELKTLKGHDKSIDSIAFSPDGKTLASGGWGKIILWSIASGQKLQEFSGHYGSILSLAFSPDGQILASGGSDQKVKLWNIGTGQELKTLSSHTGLISALAFSPDGKMLASGSNDTSVSLWDIASGKELHTLLGHIGLVNVVAFSPDGKTLASGKNDNKIKFWDTASGRELKTFQADALETTREVFAVVPKFYENIVSNGRFEIRFGENNKLNLFDIKTGKLAAGLVVLDENDWAVVTPEGLFDASAGGRKLMHYVVGLEPVSLEQMKDLYYVPGLLQKIYENEPLPKVELFSKKDLFPAVEFSQPNAGQKDLIIKLKNRGGGIGQVQILINDKEFIADARPAKFDSNAKEATLKISLNEAPLFNDRKNKIEVVAKNASGSLSNRGTARGSDLIVLKGSARQTETPDIYVIVSGISNYTGDNLDLSFAAKDAEDFAKTIELGATKLLGDKSKFHIRLLTSNAENSNVKFDAPDAKVFTASKADFQRAFEDFSKAQPTDVFIVYMAGHGVSLNLNDNPNQAGGDTYLYLTQEATTTDKSVLSVKQSREAMTVSSEELKDLMKRNKALKQVLILDTCAAGALSESLTGKRDLPSDQIRAIERLKDNTGFYVLMGSAANAVSYEASQYGQGLLTYSLLQAMKGAKLRENQFADVNLLFGYAQDVVPQLAKNIGGIQQPRIITPDTSASFDIGKFTEIEQGKINLSSPKPIILNPNLQNETLRFDNLRLTAILRNELRNRSFVETRGANSPIVFIEADEMIDAVSPSGGYKVDGENLTITVVLVKNNKLFGKELTVAGNVGEKEMLVKKLVAEIIKATQIIK